ncbi:MAG: T9SS type A sorting domain-containing protein, partial [Bacteroidetes bacterium]|nr:T9SS type A sorting domain-containing protein [Bacteroidota bacterium]
MVAWWHLDYSARDGRQDIAGFNNVGTMINGPLQVAGKVLGALQFDGVDDYVEVADHPELNFGTGDFSFDAWIKTSENIGVKQLVSKRSSTGYGVFLNSGNLSLTLSAPSIAAMSWSPSVFVADGNWHHIAVTVSRTNKQGIVFYLDGVATPYGDPTPYQGSLTNSASLLIGAQQLPHPSFNFKGILDEIELFKRVLTPAEVLAIYNAGSAGKCKPNSNGGSVSGGVWHDLDNDGVRDPNEVGLTQWPVLLNGPTIVQTQTDENGNFDFSGCRPGSYTLSVAKPNGWSHTKPDIGSYTFEIGPAQTIDGLHFGFANDPCGDGIKTWSPLDDGLGGGVTCLATDGQNLYAGGYFLTTGNNQTVNHIAKWNGQSWSPLVGSNGVVGVNGNVYAIAVSGNKVYVGGQFTSAGGVTANSIAVWDGISWSPLIGTNGVNGVSSSVNPQVLSLAELGNELYVGGLFTSAGGITANNIAKWNGTNWSAFGNGFDNAVTSLAVIGTDIFAGGFFEHSGNLLVNKIAKWNGTNWLSLNNGIDDNVWAIMNLAWVYALATDGNQIYAGGMFELAGGLWAKNIAKWNGASWSALGLGSGGVNSDVRALAFMGGNLYAGGLFTTTNPANLSASANRIAKWDGSNYSALGSGMFGNSGCSVTALTVIGDDIYAGGNFFSAGGVYANNIAKYSCSGTTTSVGDDNSNYTLPQRFLLEQNYPNPFNPTSTIRYEVPEMSFVNISVYDILGREIKVLVNEQKSPGHYQVIFDAKNLASGVYFYIIRTGNFTQSKKMILLR